MLGVMSQTRGSGGNRTHDPYANNLRIFFPKEKLVYLLINYNEITNYIPIIYELSNFDHMLGFSGGNRNHDPYANSLAHNPLDYQSTRNIS